MCDNKNIQILHLLFEIAKAGAFLFLKTVLYSCYTEEKQNIERKQNMVILGVDLGKARTGIAVCDKSELLASPVEVVNEHNRERLLERVAQLAKARRAEQIVVGLPRNMDGSEGESAQNARAFGAELAEKTEIGRASCRERV